MSRIARPATDREPQQLSLGSRLSSYREAGKGLACLLRIYGAFYLLACASVSTIHQLDTTGVVPYTNVTSRYQLRERFFHGRFLLIQSPTSSVLCQKVLAHLGSLSKSSCE